MKAAIKALLIKELEGFKISKKKINGLAGKLERSILAFAPESKTESKTSVFDPRPDSMKENGKSIAVAKSEEGTYTPGSIGS